MNYLPSILSTVVFLPLLGTVLVVALPSREKNLLRAVALLTSLATFAASLNLWFAFDPAASGFQAVERFWWLWVFGVQVDYHLGVDGISLLLVLLTTFITPVVILSSWHAIEDKVKGYHACFLVLETAMLGTFLALDMVLFYIFWEAMLLPMYFIIGVWGGPRRLYATIKFVLFTIVPPKTNGDDDQAAGRAGGAGGEAAEGAAAAAATTSVRSGLPSARCSSGA